mgnify:CR=1 FL=1
MRRALFFDIRGKSLIFESLSHQVQRFKIDTHNFEAMAEMPPGKWDMLAEQEGLAVREKALIVCLCLFGVLAVSYGMIKGNNAVFILGLLFVIGGYLLIRRKLKESIKRRS